MTRASRTVRPPSAPVLGQFLLDLSQRSTPPVPALRRHGDEAKPVPGLVVGHRIAGEVEQECRGAADQPPSPGHLRRIDDRLPAAHRDRPLRYTDPGVGAAGYRSGYRGP